MSQWEISSPVPQSPDVAFAQFAVLLDETGGKVHVGCVMEFGRHWVDVSLPKRFILPEPLWITYYPDPTRHAVVPVSRKTDRVRFEYRGPAPDVNLRLAKGHRQPFSFRR